MAVLPEQDSFLWPAVSKPCQTCFLCFGPKLAIVLRPEVAIVLELRWLQFWTEGGYSLGLEMAIVWHRRWL